MSAKSALLVSVILGATAAPVAAEVPTDALARPAHRCGTRQVPLAVDPSAGEAVGGAPRDVIAAGAQRTIYLNKNGGTYNISNAATNAATNTANAQIMGTGSRTAVIPAIATIWNWPAISACVTAYFRPYNVRVVEAEPTSGPYIEAVVGGTGAEIGFGGGQLFGIASADNFCGVTENGIAFTFSETHRGVPQAEAELCATIAHEVGHLLALEHTSLSVDLMSYVFVDDINGNKSFADQFAQCGVDPQSLNPCSCGGAQTNTHQRLMSAVGLRPTENVPPTLSVSSPGDRATVPPAFEVVARASDNAEMADVRVQIDGVDAGAASTPEGDRYTVRVAGIAEGARTMRVIARDTSGNETTVERSITVQKAQFGDDCVDSSACSSGLCAMFANGDAFCTQTCQLGAGDTCPSGSTCTDAGGTAVCVPEDGGGCGCTSASPGDGLGALLMLGVGLTWSRRRRRARRAV